MDESAQEDVCQEVWKAAFEGVADFRGAGDGGAVAPKTWLIAIAKNKAADCLRRQYRGRVEPLEAVISRLVVSSARGPSKQAAAQEQRAIVLKLIAELDPVERVLLVWRYFEGCMPAEWLDRARREGCAATLGIENEMASLAVAEGDEKARLERVLKERLMKRLERAVEHTVDRWAAFDAAGAAKADK